MAVSEEEYQPTLGNGVGTDLRAGLDLGQFVGAQLRQQGRGLIEIFGRGAHRRGAAARASIGFIRNDDITSRAVSHQLSAKGASGSGRLRASASRFSRTPGAAGRENGRGS